MASPTSKSFLIEFLLIGTAVALLAGVFVISMNPGQIVVRTRNVERQAAVKRLLNAVYAYGRDHGNTLPPTIMFAQTCGAFPIQEICRSGTSCFARTDLSVLVPTYLPALPLDPKDPGGNGTGYAITRRADGSVVVCSLRAELGERIEAGL